MQRHSMRDNQLPTLARKSSARRLTSPVLASNFKHPIQADEVTRQQHSSKQLRAQHNSSVKDLLLADRQNIFRNVGTREDVVIQLNRIWENSSQIRKFLSENCPASLEATLRQRLINDTVLIVSCQKILGNKERVQSELIESVKHRIQYEAKMHKYRVGLEDKENRITSMIDNRLQQLKYELVRPK